MITSRAWLTSQSIGLPNSRGPFTDHRAFEFGEASEHLQEHPARGGGGIHRLDARFRMEPGEHVSAGPPLQPFHPEPDPFAIVVFN